ncbi:MAG: hypothetical protein LH610_00385 [Sphingomonas bacterium]|nr:hypothetical protein [Sphingomonas bacterium]
MIDLDPCLAGCDAALAEAEVLLAMLSGESPIDAELGRVRRSVAALRHEVDRLRGIKVARVRRNTDPFWMELRTAESPWPPGGAPVRDRG